MKKKIHGSTICHDEYGSISCKSTQAFPLEYAEVLMTYLVCEDLGQDAGLLFESRHTSENLRAALHHVYCVAHT